MSQDLNAQGQVGLVGLRQHGRVEQLRRPLADDVDLEQSRDLPGASLRRQGDTPYLIRPYAPAMIRTKKAQCATGKQVTAMAQKTFVPPPERPGWEPPAAEEITVSAEATMYTGTWTDQDWV